MEPKYSEITINVKDPIGAVQPVVEGTICLMEMSATACGLRIWNTTTDGEPTEKAIESYGSKMMVVRVEPHDYKAEALELRKLVATLEGKLAEAKTELKQMCPYHGGDCPADEYGACDAYKQS